MAIGEKYAPLGNWLKEHGGDSVKLTFDELNQIIPIPNHAYKNRPSWANLSNPASFCSSWISAGYVVDSISLEEQWGVKDYVMGLEPGNCYPDGRDVMREKGLLQFLAPGEKKTYGVRLTMLENETQFEALKQK